MGITRTTAQLLLSEAAKRPFRGSVATLGRQHIYFSLDDLRGWAARDGIPLASGVPVQPHRELHLAERGWVSDETVLASLGFERIVRIDVSNYEEVEVLFDLNAPETPPELCGQFDVILNLGTLEHVFHIPNALAHLHRMLRPGGRIVHLFPSANCLDHGFVCVSPTFVTDYYAANRYRIHEVSLLRYRTDHELSGIDVYDYLQPSPYGCPVGGLDDRIYHTFAVVERGPESTADVVPQQSFYTARWQTDGPPGGTSADTVTMSRADRLKEATARWPVVRNVAAAAIDGWRWLRRTAAKWRNPVPWKWVRRLD